MFLIFHFLLLSDVDLIHAFFDDGDPFNCIFLSPCKIHFQPFSHSLFLPLSLSLSFSLSLSISSTSQFHFFASPHISLLMSCQALDHKKLALQYAVYLDLMHHFRTVLPGRVVDIRFVLSILLPNILKLCLS